MVTKRTSLPAGRPAWAGVDTHRDTHCVALIDDRCRVIGTEAFPTDDAGIAAAVAFIGGVPVGVEGTRSYGATLTRALMGAGCETYEVVRPRRDRTRRRRGKSDPEDAIRAARTVAAGDGIPVKLLEGGIERLRMLMCAREQFTCTMTRLSNCIDSLLLTASGAVTDTLRPVKGAERMRLIAGSTDPAAEPLVPMARLWLELRELADAYESQIRDVVMATFPRLLGAPGVGAVDAARLVLAAGSNPERMADEAAFSMLCGTSPLDASSGRQVNHRLNRGGNRQANRAIHSIVRVRMATDPRTADYIARRMSQGRTKREAVRCVCRFVAREVYRLLTCDQSGVPDPKSLAGRRRALGLRQRDVAETIGSSPARISCLERGATFDVPLLEAYEACVSAAERKRIHD